MDVNKLKMFGTISCAEDQTMREFMPGERVVLVVEAKVVGLRVTGESADEPIRATEFRATAAYQVDDDIAGPILADLREQVRADG